MRLGTRDFAKVNRSQSTILQRFVMRGPKRLDNDVHIRIRKKNRLIGKGNAIDYGIDK